ncbi:autophagy-related protein 16-1 [Myripristis murdjan]|uniref:autophagy-related protein 16-1 n=1 Tax=Myripristis murdjan TaxID=586833 RepID=UPI0011763B51|nr:autophagy-related protein 16-1-like [Myripristis murdjan]
MNQNNKNLSGRRGESLIFDQVQHLNQFEATTRQKTCTTIMGNWKNHVRDRLLQRDKTQKDPYTGVFTRLSQLAERFEIRKHILDEIQSKSLEGTGAEGDNNSRLLQLQLRESEHLAGKLSQTVSDLTCVLYLKEAELQHWQSQVSRYRQEALSLAKGSKTLKATLSECEFTIESQSKELAALRTEQRQLSEMLAEAWREKEELLQRWMEEKQEEADRVNKYNDTQERWQCLARRLNKHLRREKRKHYVPTVTQNGTTEMSPSATRRNNNKADMHQGRSDNCIPTMAKV